MVTGPRFEDLTECTGIPISAEGAEMMCTRYQAASDMAEGKKVLELGCGTGQGFRLIGNRAARVVGGDFSGALLRGARNHYANQFPLVRLSGDVLPFRDAAFDLVLFFEATYYVPDMAPAFREISRVLAPGGTVFFVNANPERPDFIRSPHSVHYHSADEFRSALSTAGMTVEVAGAFPVEPRVNGRRQLVSRVLSLARKVLESVGLIPRTLRGRARLKRLVYGHLLEVPAELPANFAPVAPRTAVGPGPVTGHKVIYVTGRKSPR